MFSEDRDMLIRLSESMKTVIMFYKAFLQRAELPLREFSEVLQLVHTIQTHTPFRYSQFNSSSSRIEFQNVRGILTLFGIPYTWVICSQS